MSDVSNKAPADYSDLNSWAAVMSRHTTRAHTVTAAQEVSIKKKNNKKNKRAASHREPAGGDVQSFCPEGASEQTHTEDD